MPDQPPATPRRAFLAMLGSASAASVAVPGSAVAAPTRGEPAPDAVVHLRDTPGLVADGKADDTTAVQRFAQTCLTSKRPLRACLDGLTVRVGTVDWSGARDLIVDGGGATILPTTPTGGRFVQTGGAMVEYRALRFAQAPGINYMPALFVTGVGGVRIVQNRFDGCGFGARAQDCTDVLFADNLLTQIGVYPRPAAVGVAGAAGFLPGYELYGAGLKAAACSRVTFVDNVLRNDAPAGGHVADGSGGAGGFCAYLCDDVLFQGGVADGAPGQGFVATGAWQGTDVIAAMAASRAGGATFDIGRRGRNVRFIGCVARRSNQEGITAFGCGNVVVSACQTDTNRMCSIELWQCWDVIVQGNICREPSERANPIVDRTKGSGVNGDAIHVVGVAGGLVSGNIIRDARLNAIVCNGSQRLTIDGNIIGDYGSDDLPEPYRASGILIERLDGGSIPDAVVVSRNRFERRARRINAGADIFVGAEAGMVRVADNVADGRAVTAVNRDVTDGIARYMGQEGLSFGGSMGRPYVRQTAGAAIHVKAGAAATLCPLPLIVAGQANGYDITLAICDDANGDTMMVEQLLVARRADGTGSCTVAGTVTTNPVPPRRYAVVGGSLRLLLEGSGAFTIKVVKMESYITGSRYV